MKIGVVLGRMEGKIVEFKTKKTARNNSSEVSVLSFSEATGYPTPILFLILGSANLRDCR